MTDSCKVLAKWNGYCADCERQRPLVLVERGCFGVAAWLRGLGSEDRTLCYACRVCGRVEQVPATAAEDARYDATLPRWPDLDLVAEVALLQATAAAHLPGGNGDPASGRRAEPPTRIWEDPHLAAAAELSALVMYDVPRPAHLHIHPDGPPTAPPMEAILPTDVPEPREPLLPSAVPDQRMPRKSAEREPSPGRRSAIVLVVSRAPMAAPLRPTDLVLLGLAA
ncbi:MAG: hypothetical protein Q8R60_08550 [Mycobacteriales bacterium]|nr:hypothetical protein [Mycobacteriales bacterium]